MILEGRGLIPGTTRRRVLREQVVSNNEVLVEYGEKMTINATYVYQTLFDAGWTHESICAFLGNVQVESYINPGKIEKTDRINKGFGLVAWTPIKNDDDVYVDYFGDWVIANGYARDDIDAQLLRILEEVKDRTLEPRQWGRKSRHQEYPITFHEFTKSSEIPEVLMTDSIEFLYKTLETKYDEGDLTIIVLTEVFMGTYEGPGIDSHHLDWRITHALYWDKYFSIEE